MKQDMLMVEKKENIATVILHHPEKRNSLTPDMLEQIEEVFTGFCRDDSIRTVVIRGSGDRTFCSGYDIRSLPVKVKSKELEEMKEKNPLERALKSIEGYPYPVIAMLNGHAFGAGCELAVTCDFRIGADDIQVGMPPAKIGIVYSASGLKRFIQTIGLRSTKEMFYTGDLFSGSKLTDAGLVDYLVSRDQLESFTYDLAARISGNAPLALKGTKKIIHMLMQRGNLSQEDQRAAVLLAEKAFQSDDLKEGQVAFFERRKPVFTGK
jgi:enoyl-CoA hydratase